MSVYACPPRRIDLKVKTVFAPLSYSLDLAPYNNLLFERKRPYGHNETCSLTETGDDDLMVLILADDEVTTTATIYPGRKSEGLISLMHGPVLVLSYS